MKTKFLSVLALTAILFSSCNNDDDIIDSNAPVAVQFTSGITVQETTTRAINNAWSADDAIGVWMLKTGGNTISEEADNKKYTTTAGDGVFTADATNTIYYPVDGSSVDFLAYYPHSALVSGFVYPIDVSNQANQEDLDFMVSDKEVGNNKNNTTVGLTFNHKLSKLILNVSAGDGVVDLTGLTVNIKGMNTTTTYDIDAGSWGANATLGDIIPAGSGTTFEAVLLPEDLLNLTTAPVIEFAVGGNTYVWKMTEGADKIVELKSGSKYEYTITVQKTPAVISGTITDWDPITGKTGVAK